MSFKLILNPRNAVLKLAQIELDAPSEADAIDAVLVDLAADPARYEHERFGRRSFLVQVIGTPWIISWTYSFESNEVIVGTIFHRDELDDEGGDSK